LSSNVLRFTTAGNVDDGKSTLIGRLLVETQGAFEDQIEGAKRENERRGGKGIDFSLLTDGLKAEREQGITIDVAYRYFATPRRKFIIADAPGHEQYTRNLVTSASNSDLAVILIDARNGMMTQSRRHTFIAHLLGIRHFIVAINKMDLVDFSRQRYEEIKRDFNDFISRIGAAAGGAEVYCIPISALQGDHVTEISERMPWYTGPKMLELLESIQVDDAAHKLPFRFAVQLVSRPPASPEFPDFRGYMGRVASGSVRVGDRILVLPSGARSTITGIITRAGPLQETFARQSVTLTLAHDLDISRGDIIAIEERPPVVRTDFKATVCWMNERKLHLNHRYLLRHTTKSVRAIINEIDYRLNVNTLERESPVSELQTNDIGQVRIKTLQPVVCDPYNVNRQTGGFIIIDENNDTVAAGMIQE
jgi:sulfate adenylyltransferase subunit 1